MKSTACTAVKHVPPGGRMVNMVQCLLFEALETSNQGGHSFSVLDSCIRHVSLSVSELRHSGNMSVTSGTVAVCVVF